MVCRRKSAPTATSKDELASSTKPATRLVDSDLSPLDGQGHQANKNVTIVHVMDQCERLQFSSDDGSHKDEQQFEKYRTHWRSLGDENVVVAERDE